MSDGDDHLSVVGTPPPSTQGEGAQDLVNDARWVHRFQ